jgi:hypothetical protein
MPKKSKPVDSTPEERAALRAQHTCVKTMSSIGCRACDRGVPYPHQTIEELVESMGANRIKTRFRGMSPHRYKDNPLERKFAELWQKVNDGPNGGRTALDYLMDPTNRGYPEPQITDRDWQIANTVIQWLGSPVGQNFLREVISSDEGRYFRNELEAQRQIIQRLKK